MLRGSAGWATQEHGDTGEDGRSGSWAFLEKSCYWPQSTHWTLPSMASTWQRVQLQAGVAISRVDWLALGNPAAGAWSSCWCQQYQHVRIPQLASELSRSSLQNSLTPQGCVGTLPLSNLGLMTVSPHHLSLVSAVSFRLCRCAPHPHLPISSTVFLGAFCRLLLLRAQVLVRSESRRP